LPMPETESSDAIKQFKERETTNPDRPDELGDGDRRS
jgi:hypothetical protein